MLSQIPFTGGVGRGCPQKKVAQNDVKHILVLEFLRFDDFFGVMGGGGGGVHEKVQKTTNQPYIQPNEPTDTMMTR